MTNEEILLKIEADKKRQSLKNVASLSPQTRNSIRDISYTTGFGQLYDKTWDGDYEMKFENYLGLENNEDRLAKQQSGWEQVGNGLAKNLMKTGLYALDGINTFTYGLYSAISDGKWQSLWDNDVSNFLDDASKRLDRNFANYYTNEEKSKGFLGRLWENPANFFANDVAGGLAFVGGAVLPELALGVLTGGASLSASLAKMTAKTGLKTAFKSADNIAGMTVRNGIEEAVEKATVQATRKQAKDGISALMRSKVGKKVGDVANFARFVGQSTFFEAGMEARHNFHDSIDTYMRDFQEREGRLPSQEELTDYIGDASKAADYVFGANVALLSVTNAAMFGKVFNLPSLNLDTKIGKAFGINVTKLPTGKMAITNATKAQRVAGNAYFLGKKPFSEGIVEEGLQGVFGGTMDNYLKAKYDPNQDDVSLLNSFGEALKDQYTTKEGWFEIGIGAIIGMVGGNVSGDFGIEGVGKKGYSGARKGLEANINTYNEGTAKALEGDTNPETRVLKNLMRTNSISNFNANKEAGIDNSPAFQDTIVSYNYIKANEALKGYVNTIEDFNTAIDAVEFTPEQMQTFGFRTEADLDGYKNSLKENFAKDYEIYQEADTIVNNLNIPNYKKGELAEFRDAVTFSLMAGKKAGVESEKIARNISEITGINGIYDAMKFSQEMKDKSIEDIQTLKEKQARLEELKNEILDVGQRLQDSKDNENLYKENSKKNLILAQEIKKLTDETAELESVLENDFQAMQAEITFTPQQMSTTGIKDIMDSMSGLESYISALEKTGRTTEAKNLKTLLEQFNLYSLAEINAVSTIRRMSETNFYSSKEGKELLNKIKGEDYSMSESTRKEIRDSEEEVRNILIKNGFEFDNVSEQIEKALKNNESLSERQKFKTESMLRAILAYRRIQDLVENAQEEATTAEQSAEEDFFQEGDTIRIARRLQGEDLTNPESINELIKKITNEIDVIVNKPTAESLREIKAKEAEIEQLRQQILDLQNQPVQEQEEVTPEQESEEELTILESLQRDLEFELTSEFGSPEMAEKIKEQIDSLTEEEIDEVINEIEQEDENTGDNKQTENDITTKTSETIQEKIARLDGKQVSVNGKLGKLKVINDNRIEVENETDIYEYTLEQVFNINEVLPTTKYDVKNITEDSVTVNDVDYTINTDDKGNVISVSPRNNPTQNIKNEPLLVAIEIERNKGEYSKVPDNNVLESVKNNYPNLDLILDNVWATNMTDTVAIGLDKLHAGEVLTEQEALQVALWLQDVFDRISILYKKENSELENETLLNAYNTAIIINELLYQTNNTKIEGYDTTRENGTDIGGETVTNTDGANRENVTEETVETTQPINATSDIENQIQEITQSIQKLEDEISDLRTPFKFMDSEGYIRYNKLLQKKINEGQLSPQEEEELANLENSIDQWITISGVRVQGIELSDLIKQLQALENTVVIEENGGTLEINDEEVDEDARQSEDSVQNNYDVGLSYNGVVSRRTKDSVIISNITETALEEASGVTLKGREGVSKTETGGIKLSNDIVREINELGKVVILNPAYDEVSSYYSLVLESIPNPITGVLELYPIKSDFDIELDDKGQPIVDENGDPILYQDGVISPDTIYQAKKGETILFKIDPRQPYNRDLLNELRNEMGITKPLTEEEFKAEVDKIVQARSAKSKTIEKTQAEIAQYQGREINTAIKARLNLLEKRLKEQIKEIRDKAEDEVTNRKEKAPKKPKKETVDKIIRKLRIMAINEAGENLQILKGIRTTDGYEGTNAHFEALRIKLASDPQLLLDLIEANNFETYDEGVTISKIFMGLPNYNYVRTAGGTTRRQYKPIVKEDLSKIEDIGYISGGKLQLRSGKTDNVNTDFVKTALNRKSKEKSPVVVIRKGNHLIVYPVKVGRNESPIDLEAFKTIYESGSITAVEKAIRLNTMLSQAGINVKQKGDAFVVIGDNTLNSDFFNNIFARLTEKEYIRSVDSWTDSKQSIEDALLNNASANIRFSDPFISPKVKFDFSNVEVQEIPETKKTSTKKAVVDNKQSNLKKYRCKK